MKYFNQNVLLGISALMALSSCAKVPAEVASSVPLVSAPVVFTSSAKAPGVAYNKPSLMSLLLPKAVAFIPASLRDSNAAVVTLNQAWVAVKTIKFKQAELAAVGEDNSVKFVGPYFVDLLSTLPIPIDTQSLPAGSYRRIEFVLHAGTTIPAGVPAQLNGNSIYLNGAVNGFSFTYTSTDGAQIMIAGPKGLPLDGSSDILISVRLADIFSKINMAAVNANVAITQANRLPAANPCPLIDASAADIYTCIRRGLELKTQMGLDSNHSGEIEATESEVHQTI